MLLPRLLPLEKLDTPCRVLASPAPHLSSFFLPVLAFGPATLVGSPLFSFALAFTLRPPKLFLVTQEVPVLGTKQAIVVG